MGETNRNNWEDRLEKRIEEIEKRMESWGRTMEEKGQKFGKNIEKEVEQFTKDFGHKHHKKHGHFWGFVLIGFGLVWLGRNMGWFYFDIPWFPLMLIAGGIYMIVTHRNQDDDAN